MDIVRKDKFEYIKYESGNAAAIFFTAYEGADFYMQGENFQSNMNMVKNIFKLKNIGYNKQIHSDIITIFDKTIQEGDAIVTDEANTALGVFTADCVPVLVYDNVKKVCAAVHSGWKGTYNRITEKTIRFMKDRFGCESNNMSVFIGPHIGACCYEVGQELIELFIKDTLYKDYEIIVGRKLNLEMCIKAQCHNEGIYMGNIHTTELCTHCAGHSGKAEFHSYRKQKEKSGRMLSMIYFKE